MSFATPDAPAAHPAGPGIIAVAFKAIFSVCFFAASSSPIQALYPALIPDTPVLIASAPKPIGPGVSPAPPNAVCV